MFPSLSLKKLPLCSICGSASELLTYLVISQPATSRSKVVGKTAIRSHAVRPSREKKIKNNNLQMRYYDIQFVLRRRNLSVSVFDVLVEMANGKDML